MIEWNTELSSGDIPIMNIVVPHEDLLAFAAESNRIEGLSKPTSIQVTATRDFIALPEISVGDVEHLVTRLEPSAVLRYLPGLDVRIGNHVPISGGPVVARRLAALLDDATWKDPWHVHCEYENLHPFTDGNGRSGRALWAWQMVRIIGPYALNLGFLHRFYYQTFEHHDEMLMRVAQLEAKISMLEEDKNDVDLD